MTTIMITPKVKKTVTGLVTLGIKVDVEFSAVKNP